MCARLLRHAEARGAALHTLARTTQPCACERRIFSGITLEMSGSWRRAKPAGNCPLDRRVGRHGYLPATATSARGFVLAMASRVRAAPLGCLRPCSHPCSVRTDTPIRAANCD
jgi:hypothetical protein